MDELKKLTNKHLTEDQIEQSMNHVIKLKFENDLRNRYAEILADQYGVVRESSTADVTVPTVHTASGSKSTKLVKIGLGLLALIAGIFAVSKLSTPNPPESPKEKVQIYLAMNTMQYHGVSRSESSELNQNRAAAYTALNKKDFVTAKEKLQTVADINAEDEFYLAYLKMRDGQYQEAALTFKAHTAAKGKYAGESVLYEALCLSMTDPAAYKALVQSLPKSDWAYKQLVVAGLEK